jgi:hypothetical protein
LADFFKALVASPPVLLLCLGLALVLLGILGRSPIRAAPFVLGRFQRIVFAAIGLALGGTGLGLVLPGPAHFAISGKVVDKANGAPLSGAAVEAHDDATSDKPRNLAYTDDGGAFYLNYGQADEGRYIRLRVVKDNFAASTLYVLIKPARASVTFALAKTGFPGGLQAVAAGTPEAALDYTPLRSGQIVVWVVARPDYYSPAVATSFAKDFSTGKLVERQIPRETFVSQVNANPTDDSAPDLAFLDNYSLLEPLLQAKTVWLAWGEPRFATRGWWVIFKTTKHLTQARAFVRWLARAPGWQPRAKNVSIAPSDISTVQNASIMAIHDLLSGGQVALEALLDKDAARGRPVQEDASTQLSDVQPILTFGNSRIAFTLLAVIASSDSFYGMRHMIFIFRNQGAGWRILMIQPNAPMPDSEGVQGIEANPPLLRAFDSHIVSDQAEPPPPAAVLVAPPDRAMLPRFPHLPDIAWRSAASADASFIVESQFSDPGDEANWSVSNLTFAAVSRATQSFEERAPFGVGAQPHRWRIWTLGRSGTVSLTPWRTVLYTN